MELPESVANFCDCKIEDFINDFIPLDLFDAKVKSIVGHLNVGELKENIPVIDWDDEEYIILNGTITQDQTVCSGQITITLDNTKLVLQRLHSFVFESGDWNVVDEYGDYQWAITTKCRDCKSQFYFSHRHTAQFKWMDPTKNEFRNCKKCREINTWKCIANRSGFDKDLKVKVAKLI